MTAIFNADQVAHQHVMFHEDSVISGGTAPYVFHWSINGDMRSKVPCSASSVFNVAINDTNNENVARVRLVWWWCVMVWWWCVMVILMWWWCDFDVRLMWCGMWFNSQELSKLFWPCDAIHCHGFWSSLVQVMACCLTAPSHYLSQYWHVGD